MVRAFRGCRIQKPSSGIRGLTRSPHPSATIGAPPDRSPRAARHRAPKRIAKRPLMVVSQVAVRSDWRYARQTAPKVFTFGIPSVQSDAIPRTQHRITPPVQPFTLLSPAVSLGQMVPLVPSFFHAQLLEDSLVFCNIRVPAILTSFGMSISNRGFPIPRWSA